MTESKESGTSKLVRLVGGLLAVVLFGASCGTSPLASSLPECWIEHRNDDLPQTASITCVQEFHSGGGGERDSVTREVEFSSDGLRLYTSSNKVQEWLIATGAQVSVCPESSDDDCVITGGGEMIVTDAGYLGYINSGRVFAGPMYEEQQVADSDVPPYSYEVYVEPWNALLSYNESLFRFYDVRTGDFLQEVPVETGIEQVVAGTNSYSVANLGHEILNLPLTEEHESKLLQGHQAPIAEMVYSDDDSQLVSIDADGHLIIWDTVTGEKLLDIVVVADDMFIGGDLFSPNVDMALSPDNSLLVVNAVSQLLTFYDTSTGEVVAELEMLEAPFDVDFSPDGTQLAVGLLYTGVYNQNPTRSTLQPGPAVILDISGIG